MLIDGHCRCRHRQLDFRMPVYRAERCATEALESGIRTKNRYRYRRWLVTPTINLQDWIENMELGFWSTPELKQEKSAIVRYPHRYPYAAIENWDIRDYDPGLG